MDYLFGPENLMNRYDGNAEMVNTFNDMTLFASYLRSIMIQKTLPNYKLNGKREGKKNRHLNNFSYINCN